MIKPKLNNKNIFHKTSMKNIFLLILLTIFSAPTYSQDSVSIKVFNKLKSERILHKQVKFDTVKIKPLVDSIKNWIIVNDRIDFPDYCPRDGSVLLNLSEVSNCFLDYDIGFFIGAIDNIDLPWWIEMTEDEIVDHFVNRLTNYILENSSELWYFYSDYFYISELIYRGYTDKDGKLQTIPEEYPVGVFLFLLRE